MVSFVDEQLSYSQHLNHIPPSSISDYVLSNKVQHYINHVASR